jgi:hypothetical protein
MLPWEEYLHANYGPGLISCHLIPCILVFLPDCGVEETIRPAVREQIHALSSSLSVKSVAHTSSHIVWFFSKAKHWDFRFVSSSRVDVQGRRGWTADVATQNVSTASRHNIVSHHTSSHLVCFHFHTIVRMFLPVKSPKRRVSHRANHARTGISAREETLSH